jgi:hypothetical protein
MQLSCMIVVIQVNYTLPWKVKVLSPFIVSPRDKTDLDSTVFLTARRSVQHIIQAFIMPGDC